MNKARIEAFSDGVLAIVITIMVLEMKVPERAESLGDLKPLVPVFLSYVLSFVYLGVYWNNHHHLLQATPYSTSGIMWANLHLLFWVSLIPFATGWLGASWRPETRDLAPVPTALYGAVLLCAAVAYVLLQWRIVRVHGADSPLARAIGRDLKGKSSNLLYLVAVPCAFWSPWVSVALYVLVALVWLVPDRRIERALVEAGEDRGEGEISSDGADT